MGGESESVTIHESNNFFTTSFIVESQNHYHSARTISLQLLHRLVRHCVNESGPAVHAALKEKCAKTKLLPNRRNTAHTTTSDKRAR